MDVIVCVKWVPDTSEADLAVAKGEVDIDKDDLDFDVNDWDRFAIEEAVRIKEETGGKVTAISVAPEDAEQMLRETLARGADEAFLLWDESFEGSDGYVTANILSNFIKKRPYDLILTGTQADDDCAGQLGGMLGAMLDVPHATLVHEVKAQDGKLNIVRELEGGLSELLELDLPAVISVATGLNEPRFVSIRAVRKVAGMDIPTLGLDEVGLQEDEVGSEGAKIHVEKMFLPPVGEGAEIITGSAEEASARLAQILKERGGIG